MVRQKWPEKKIWDDHRGHASHEGGASPEHPRTFQLTGHRPDSAHQTTFAAPTPVHTLWTKNIAPKGLARIYKQVLCGKSQTDIPRHCFFFQLANQISISARQFASHYRNSWLILNDNRTKLVRQNFDFSVSVVSNQNGSETNFVSDFSELLYGRHPPVLQCLSLLKFLFRASLFWLAKNFPSQFKFTSIAPPCYLQYTLDWFRCTVEKRLGCKIFLHLNWSQKWSAQF